MNTKKFGYKLLKDVFSRNELKKGIRLIKSVQIKISKKSENFEKYFANSLLKISNLK